MTKPVTNHFLRDLAATRIVVAGSMFNEYWREFYALLQRGSAIQEKEGAAYSLVHFQDGDKKLPLYLRPTAESSQMYQVHVQGIGTSFVRIGYSVPNLIEILSSPDAVQECLPEGFNFTRILFGNLDPDHPYCLAFPSDNLANLELEVRIEKVEPTAKE